MHGLSSHVVRPPLLASHIDSLTDVFARPLFPPETYHVTVGWSWSTHLILAQWLVYRPDRISQSDGRRGSDQCFSINGSRSVIVRPLSPNVSLISIILSVLTQHWYNCFGNQENLTLEQMYDFHSVILSQTTGGLNGQATIIKYAPPSCHIQTRTNNTVIPPLDCQTSSVCCLQSVSVHCRFWLASKARTAHPVWDICPQAPTICLWCGTGFLL